MKLTRAMPREKIKTTTRSCVLQTVLALAFALFETFGRAQY